MLTALAWRIALVGVFAAHGARAAQSPAEDARVEGAVGLIVRHGPEFSGARDTAWRATPAGFLRWGRITLTGAGGFTTRADETVERGLSAEISRRGHLRLTLGLRGDAGRDDRDSPELAGLGPVRRTVRARLAARWDPDPDWRVTAGWSLDALGRGQGYFMDVAASRRWSINGGDSLWIGVSASGAGDRYMQLWHGVSPAQSVASGLPLYRAAEGLRDLHLSLTWRNELGLGEQRFGVYTALDASRLLGSAADSPITRRRSALTGSAGLVWRF